MSYNILGINLSHNGSLCILKDGKVDFYLEEERLSRKKWDTLPLKTLYKIYDKYIIDEIVVTGINLYAYESKTIPLDDQVTFLIDHILKKFYKDVPVTFYLNDHHLTHAFTAFYNSGFKEAISLIIDGSGSLVTQDNKNGLETESIFQFKLPSNFNTLFKNYRWEGYKKDDGPTLGKVYELITHYLGFDAWGFDCGKTMGLASYGLENSSIPNIISNKKGSLNIFTPIRLDSKNFKVYDIDIEKNPILHIDQEYKWHKDSSQKCQVQKDVAYKLQNNIQKEVGDIIETIIKNTSTSYICCSGGYFLNCVSNYYLKKRFPNINFYFEPISHDGGTCIGASKYHWHLKNPKHNSLQKNIYYGPKYTKTDILRSLKKYI